MKKQSEEKKHGVTKRILNCNPSRNQESDWLVLNAEEAGAVGPSSAIPVNVDLRDDSWWKIGDQGNTGSCVGWATADSVLRWHFVNNSQISKADQLSVRYTWMSSKETDEFVNFATTFLEEAGTSIKAALDVVRKYGIVKNAILPFEPITLSFLQPATFYTIAASLKINSYINLRMPGGPITRLWKGWIATKGPIVTRLTVDQTWDNVAANGNLDTYVPYPPDNPRAGGGHAVAIVGYTKDRFIVRNSWGTSWGDKGYGYASNNYANKAFTEAYGVNV